MKYVKYVKYESESFLERVCVAGNNTYTTREIPTWFDEIVLLAPGKLMVKETTGVWNFYFDLALWQSESESSYTKTSDGRLGVYQGEMDEDVVRRFAKGLNPLSSESSSDSRQRAEIEELSRLTANSHD